jgi:hypothetical protein
MHSVFKASSSIKTPSNPQYNQWLSAVLAAWRSHPNCVIPTQRIGEEIILALLLHPSEIPLISHNPSLTTVHLIGEPTFSSGIKPTLAMVFRDMMEGDKDGLQFNIVDTITGLAENNVSTAEFLDFWTQALSSKAWSNNMRLLGALDVPCSPRGLSSCQLKAAPYQSDNNTSFNPKVKWKNGFSTTLTPPGSITNTHTDGIGCAQYMVHIWGRKLWLFWPPTEKNMNYYGSFLAQITPSHFIVDCVRRLEGLQLHYIDHKFSVFVLPPNYLHAVISVEASAHMGISFCDPAHFSESSRMMKWFLNWAKNFGHYGHTAQDSFKFARQVLEEGVGRWEEICKHSSEARRLNLKEELRQIKMECNEFLAP